MRDDPRPSDPGGDLERVYVLRLPCGPDEERAGRISLYDAESGDRLYFDSLTALLGHLRRQFGSAQTPESGTPDGPHLQS